MSVLPNIRVRNTQRKLRVDVMKLELFANRAFPDCCRLPAAEIDGIGNLREIDVILVSDRRMAALHRQFMNLAGPTDVLTFQHGEIVVSVETAQENAKRFGGAIEEEIQLYIVHGFLHLLGYNDQTSREARTMEAAQQRVLKALRASA
ncbi:MAG: rRNA maturation RNase YbeY [Chthoniobacterales bacterium]